MICDPCRDRRHGECRDGTWCDCQHKPPAGGGEAGPGADPYEPGAGPGDGAEGRNTGGDRAEPGINWLRQG